MFPHSDLKAIILDADNTLFSLRESVGTTYSKIGSKHGLSISSKLIDKVIPEVWENHRKRYLNKHDSYRTSPEREKQFWLRFVHDTLLTTHHSAPHQRLVMDIYSWYSRAESRILSPSVVDFLHHAKAKKFILGVFSNNDSRLLPLLHELEILDLLDSVFTAGSLGYKKPSQRAFQRIAQQLLLRPSEILYIGDNLELDFQAASAAGWQAVLYAPHEDTVQWPVINHFQTLVDAL